MKTRYYYTYDIFAGDGSLLRRLCCVDKATALERTIEFFQDAAKYLMQQASYGNLVNPKYHAATWKYQGRLKEGLGDGPYVAMPIRIGAL